MKENELYQKVASCKALQGLTVSDLISTDRFRNNLAAYMTAQREDRKQIRASYEAMHKAGGPTGYKLPAHPIDKVIDLSVDEFSAEFMAIIEKRNTRPFSEREYIRQLGQQAYNLTVAQYVVDEYPELEEELIPKKTN